MDKFENEITNLMLVNPNLQEALAETLNIFDIEKLRTLIKIFHNELSDEFTQSIKSITSSRFS